MKRAACPAAAVLTALLMAGRAAAEEYHLGQDDPCHTHAQAGFPLEVSHYARPSNTPSYFGYYVGGGCGGLGLCCRHRFAACRPPEPDEGTWGWDYATLPCLRPHIVLGFGAPYQGGYGSYQTDKGPKVPDVIAYRLPECCAKNLFCGEGSCCFDRTKQKYPPQCPECKRP
jgi:hypothetical protein